MLNLETESEEGKYSFLTCVSIEFLTVEMLTGTGIGRLLTQENLRSVNKV